jgi:4-hydroxybenzoate polyprenyltransferase
LQLLRAPNVFTAVADVGMGYLVTWGTAPRFPTLRLPGDFWSLIACSSFLYLAGMVLNDVYDFEVDSRERPERPLPAGRISLPTARRLGYSLLALGVAMGALSSYLTGQPRSAAVAAVLAGTVLLYDVRLKQTPVGPLAMGSCRWLNVLLGMSAAPFAWDVLHWWIASGIGVYIAGVTWFARTEATESNRTQLACATAVLVAGLGLLAWFPFWADLETPAASQPEYALGDPRRWLIMWGVVAVLIGRRCVAAIVDPSPPKVQMAVKNCILSLIMLDAICCFAVRGIPWATALLLLWIPTIFLGRWIYST